LTPLQSGIVKCAGAGVSSTHLGVPLDDFVLDGVQYKAVASFASFVPTQLKATRKEVLRLMDRMKRQNIGDKHQVWQAGIVRFV
jgi:hypothetical protein